MVDLRPGPMVVETPPQALGMFDDRWWQWIVDLACRAPGISREAGIAAWLSRRWPCSVSI
jgi:hypothetical protein